MRSAVLIAVVLVVAGCSRGQSVGPAAAPADSLGEGDYTVPDDTTDSQRGWVLGPMRYTTVLTDGTRLPLSRSGYSRLKKLV